MTFQEVLWLFAGGLVGVLSTYAIAGAVVLLARFVRKLALGNRAAVVVSAPRRG